MVGERVFGVLLHHQAWIELGAAIEPYSSTGPIGKYIYCKNLSLGPGFVAFECACSKGDQEFVAEIHVPTHYVKLIVAAKDAKQIGF